MMKVKAVLLVSVPNEVNSCSCADSCCVPQDLLWNATSKLEFH